MSNDKIEKENKPKKKRMMTSFNFLNLWPESSDQKCYAWKNREVQSLRNETLKDIIQGNETFVILYLIQNKIIVVKKTWTKCEVKRNQRVWYEILKGVALNLKRRERRWRKKRLSVPN